MISSNARDLGGLRTDDGHAVRPGLVFRSDDTFWSNRERPAALPPCIGTAIDLRRPSERSERGVPPYVDADTLQLHESLVPESRAAIVRTDQDFARFYVEVFTDQLERLGGMMRRLAEEAPTPAVVYCAAGKDRTGVTIAVLQRLLGVRRADIVADYARSAAFLGWVLSTGQLDDERKMTPHTLLPAHSAHPATMEFFLDHLDRAHGDAAELAAALGLTPGELAALRARLLQPVAKEETEGAVAG